MGEQGDLLRSMAPPREKTQGEILRELATPTWGQIGQQAASSFVSSLAGTAAAGMRAEQGMREHIPVIGPALGYIPGKIAEGAQALAGSIPPVPGQEDKLYSNVAGMGGATVALAPAALLGPGALAMAGAQVGAEQGVEAAQQAHASPQDTVYAALGSAVIGAASTYGPAGALKKFGLKPGSVAFDVVHDMLVPGVVGGAQSVATDALAGQTYDKGRTVDVGRAMETALASMAMGGTAHAVGAQANLLREMARRKGAEEAGTGAAETVAPVADDAQHATQQTPIPGMPEPAPVEPVRAADELAQPGPVSPVSPGMSGGEAGRVALPVDEVQNGERSGSHVPELTPRSADLSPADSPPAPAVSPPEGTAGVSRFTNDHIDTIGRGENKMELVARDAVGKPIGVAEYTQVGDQVNIDMVTVREDLRRQGIGKRLIEEVQKANPQATVNLGMAVSEAGEALRKSSERDLSNTYQTTAPSPETKTAAPVEALKKDEGADLPPVEVTPEQAAHGEDSDTIALRHETTAAKRAERDFPEYERTPSRKDEDLKRQAIESLTSDPFAGRKLVEKVAAGHIPDDAESFLLLAEANRLRNELKLADVEAIKDPSPQNKALVDSLSAEFNKAMDATDAAGTQQGRSFRVRAQQMREDYSLAGVVRKKAKALGRSLNEAEMEHAREVTRKLDELEKRVKDAETRQDTIEADRIAQEKVDTLKREVRSRPRTDRIQRNKERMAEIVRSFATMRASANEFANPENYKRLVEFAKLAIENGALKVADLYVHAKDLLDQFGDEVRPHLTKAWDDAVKQHHDELVTPVRERFKAGEAPGRALDTLALHLVEQGITEREALIDALHKAVPDAKREQIRDALSRYGQFKQASQEESHKTLRQLKQEMQKVAQIEALEKRMAPLKTGFDRGEPSPEYRRLAKRVEQLKKETGIRPPVDPERALKSAEASRETYLRNRITDLRDEIAAGKREARRRGEPPTNETIKALEAELEAVRAEHDAKFEEPAKREEVKKQEALERRLKDLNEKIAKGDTSRPYKATVDTAEVARLRAEIEAGNKRIAEMRAAQKPVRELPPSEIATAKRLEKQIEVLDRRIANKELAGRGEKQGPDVERVAALKARRDALNEQLARMRKDARPSAVNHEAERLEAHVKSLRERLLGKEQEARGKKQGPDTEQVTELKRERDIIHEQLKLARSKPSEETIPADILAKREKQRIASVERTAKMYERKAEEMNVRGGGTKAKPIDSPEYRSAVAHMEAARAVVDELRALANPKATPEERATKAALSRIATETAKIQQRITFKEFGPRERPAQNAAPEVIEARASRDRMKRQLDLEAFRDQQAKRTKFQKVRDAATDVVFNVPKSIFSSFDFSAVMRQGFPFTVQDLVMRQPALLARMGRMFRAFGSEQYADRVQASIESHPNYETSKKAGLELTGYGDGLTKHEEIFRSSLAAKIPGVKASERAYVTYLNLLRFEHFNRILANTEGSPEAAKSVARLVNEATGRGQVGKQGFARAIDASGKVLWAPRLYVSRFQLLYGDPILRGTGARKAIVREYATTLAATAAMYSLVALYNATNPDDEATVSLDPTSPDGGKIKIGNTRIDPLAGLQQATRLIAREGRSIGQSVQGEKPKEDAVDVALAFLRTKVSPSVSVPYELVTGKDVAFGRQVDRASALVPFSFQDIYQAMQDQGVPKGAALGILSLFGVGLNTYSDKKKGATLPVASK